MTLALSRQNLERWINDAINDFGSTDLVGLTEPWQRIYEALSQYLSEQREIDEKLIWMIDGTDDSLSDIIYMLQRLQKTLISQLARENALEELDSVLTWFNRTIVTITEKYSGESSREHQLTKPFEAIFWNARDGMYISTVEGQFVQANEALLSMLGYETLDEMRGMDIEEDLYVDQEARQLMLDHLERDGFFDHHEFEFKTRSGKRRTALESCYQVDVSDEQHYIVGIMIDITEEKETVRKTEEHLRNIETTGMETQLELRRKTRLGDAFLALNNNPVMLVDARDFRIFQVNPAFKKRFKVTRKRKERASLRDFFTSDEWMKVFSQIAYVANRHHFHVRGIELSETEEETLPVDLGVLVFQDDSGTTFLIQVEEKTEIRNQQKMLEKTRGNLEGIFDGVPVGVMGFRSDGTISFINRFMHDFIGYGPRQMKDLGFINRIFARDEQRLKFHKYMRQFLRGRHATNQAVDLRARSGEIVQFRLDTVSFHFEGDDQPGFLAMVTNINDRLELANLVEAQKHNPGTFSEAARELQNDLVRVRSERETVARKYRFLGNYIRTVTNRFKIPIHLALGYASLLKLDLDNSIHDGQQEDVAIIEDHIRFLLEMLEKATELIELESDEIEPNPSEQNVRAMVDHLFDRLEPKVLPNSIMYAAERLILSLDLVIDCDPLMLELMMRPIVENAIQYTRQGSISLTAYEEQRRLWIEVADTGIGIPSSELTQIFEPFYRVSLENDNEQHLGLGLTIARKYADIADFTLEVFSKPEEGTRVLVGVGPVAHK